MVEMKKVALKLNLHDDRDKKKAIKAVSSIAGIDSIAVNMKEGKMTIIGDADPVEVTSKLRKPWAAQIDTVGPAKEEKKTENKPSENKDNKAQIPQYIPIYPPYNCVEENPNACTIC